MIEDYITLEKLEAGDRLGCNIELSQQFDIGLGVVREALEILNVRGICAAKRGPGGGLFVARPSLAMTGQLIVHYLLTSQLTPQQFEQAGEVLCTDQAKACANRRVNPMFAVIDEVFRQMDKLIALDGANSVCRRRPDVRHLASLEHFNWELLSPDVHISSAKSVAWSLAKLISNGTYAVGEKIGSEFDLQDQWGVSVRSIRQATRLLEAFGHIEVRIGRGRGIYCSRPTQGPILRSIVSHLQGNKMSCQEWIDAIRHVGGAAITLAVDEAESREQIRAAPISDFRDMQDARQTLKNVVLGNDNPITKLLFESLAGYAFRSFDAASDPKRCGTENIMRFTPEIMSAACDRDILSSVSAYETMILSNQHWTSSSRAN